MAATLLVLCLIICANKVFAQNEGDIERRMQSLQNLITALSNQVMMQQYSLEERTRSNGKSGIKVVRLRQMGTKSYHSDSQTSFGAISLHEHANNIRTIGMGEFSAVLNGIDFKTRHNDYRLYMPHRTDQSYGAMEEVPFPEVPPSVTKQPTVEKQIAEMQEYFRAWSDENSKHRDYTNYFKPLLCYLEGAWTKTGEAIEEPFFSDRHFVDASSWMDLQQRARFSSYSGSKSQFENLAVLPSAIMSMNGSMPEYAQFNYRILCHPLKKYLPVDRFRVVDDLHNRVSKKRTIFQHERNRAARFQLSPTNSTYQDDTMKYGLLDELMSEIPGKNNYPCNLKDEGLDVPALDFQGKTMNVCRYHRIYKIGEKDATGVSVVNRGYNDEYMFAAMTTHPKIAPLSVKKKPIRVNGKKVKPTLTQRWSWAIPLEIIYLTPLHKWNPYNLQYKGDHKSKEGLTVTANKRNGQCTKGKQLDGVNSKNYFMTPDSFFGASHSSNVADTSKGAMCVLDKKGVSRTTRPSGVYVFLPRIGDLGSLRTRYPIFPVHSEGNTIWKELDALKDLVMDKETYDKYYWKISNEDESENTYYRLAYSTKSKTPHSHTLTISSAQMKSLKFGAGLTLSTSVDDGHQHELKVVLDEKTHKLRGMDCDGTGRKRCADGHAIKVIERATESEA